MKAFRFRLETLQRWRIQQRKEAEAEQVRAAAASARIVMKMQAIQKEIEANAQVNDPMWVTQAQAHAARLRAELSALGSALLDARRHEAACRQALMLAQQAEEVVESLREAEFARWRKSVQREEQKRLDDLPRRDPQKNFR